MPSVNKILTPALSQIHPGDLSKQYPRYFHVPCFDLAGLKDHGLHMYYMMLNIPDHIPGQHLTNVGVKVQAMARCLE